MTVEFLEYQKFVQLLKKLTYEDTYDTVDDSMSDSNVGGR